MYPRLPSPSILVPQKAVGDDEKPLYISITLPCDARDSRSATAADLSSQSPTIIA